jgi:hypothetical protein
MSCIHNIISTGAIFIILFERHFELSCNFIFLQENVNRILALFYCTDGRYPLANDNKTVRFLNLSIYDMVNTTSFICLKLFIKNLYLWFIEITAGRIPWLSFRINCPRANDPHIQVWKWEIFILAKRGTQTSKYYHAIYYQYRSLFTSTSSWQQQCNNSLRDVHSEQPAQCIASSTACVTSSSFLTRYLESMDMNNCLVFPRGHWPKRSSSC